MVIHFCNDWQVTSLMAAIETARNFAAFWCRSN